MVGWDGLGWAGLVFFCGCRFCSVPQVPLANLPACLDGYTLAMVSDLHAGPTVGRDEVSEA